MSQTETPKEKPKTPFEESRSSAIQELSKSLFDPEIKKEFGQKIKKTKNFEELENTMKGFLNFIAEKLKLKNEKSPTEETKLISEEKIEKKHRAQYGLEYFGVELISLCQTNPECRSSSWKKRCAKLKESLINSDLPKSDTRPLLHEMERIENQR